MVFFPSPYFGPPPATPPVKTVPASESAIKKLLTHANTCWEALSTHYQTAAHDYCILRNYDKAIEYQIKSALCELRIKRYAHAINAFATAHRILLHTPEELLDPFQSTDLLSFLSTELPSLLPPNNLFLTLQILTLLHEAFKDQRGASAYFEKLSAHYLLNENPWLSGTTVYTITLEMSTRASFSAEREENWKRCRQAMKQYELLEDLLARAFCYKVTAEMYCFDTSEKALKYLRLALDIYVSLQEKHTQEADCIKQLAACRISEENYTENDSKVGMGLRENVENHSFDAASSPTFESLSVYWSPAIYGEFQGRYEIAECQQKINRCINTQAWHLKMATDNYEVALRYISQNRPLSALEQLSRAEHHYRYLFPSCSHKVVECFKSSADLYIGLSYFMDAGQSLCQAAHIEFKYKEPLQAIYYLEKAAEQFIRAHDPDQAAECREIAKKIFEITPGGLYAIPNPPLVFANRSDSFEDQTSV